MRIQRSKPAQDVLGIDWFLTNGSIARLFFFFVLLSNNCALFTFSRHLINSTGALPKLRASLELTPGVVSLKLKFLRDARLGHTCHRPACDPPAHSGLDSYWRARSRRLRHRVFG